MLPGLLEIEFPLSVFHLLFPLPLLFLSSVTFLLSLYRNEGSLED